MNRKTFFSATSWIDCHLLLLLLLGAAFTASGAPTTNSWLYDANGDWSVSGNWDPIGVPNEAGSMAILTNNLTWTRTINLDAPVTVGTLQIGSLDWVANFVIAGANALTLDNNGAGARLLAAPGNDADAITAPLVLADHLTVDSDKKITVGAISESVSGRSITKEGDGTLVLSTASSYSGGVVINGGAVQINTETALGAVPTEPTPGNLAINGGTLVFNTGNILHRFRGVHLSETGGTIECLVQSGLYGVIEGPGQLIKTGPAALFLATNLYTGGTWLKEGRLRLGSTSPGWSQLGPGDLTMENDTSLVAWSTTARTLTNRVIVRGNITVGASSTDTAALTLSGPVDLGNELRTITTPNTANIISGEISGDGGGIIKAGAGRLSLMNTNNTFSGGVVVAEGLLRIGTHYSLGTGTLTLNEGAAFSSDGNSNRQPTNSVVINGNVTIGQASGVGAGSIYLRGPVDLGSEVRTITLGNTVTDYMIGEVSGAGGIIKRGAPTLALFGANSFGGGFTLTESTVLYYGDSAFGSGPVTMGEASGTGNLLISGDGTVSNDIEVIAGVSGTRTLGCTNNATAVYSGNINLGAELIVGAVSFYPRTIILSGSVSGSGSLRMNGVAPTNTVILSGANTYLGDTTVAGGTLVVSNATGSATSSGSVAVQANSVLAGTGTIDGAVTVDSNATLSPGWEGLGLLTINNMLTLTAGSTNLMELDKSASTNDVVVANTVNYDGTLLVANLAGTLANGDSFKLFSAGSFSGNFAEVVVVNDTATAEFNPATGVLTIIGGTATTPTNITFSVSGDTLALSWPESHLGWHAQSNSVSVADPNAWYDITGSETVTNLNLTINPALPQVYYRLRQP